VSKGVAPPVPAGKRAAAFRTIGEVAGELALPAHVLRFWESKFPQLQPLKRSGGRRYYRPEDVELLRRIRRHLHDEGYTIRGVQSLLDGAPAAEPRKAALEDIRRELQEARALLDRLLRRLAP
jgi:DNA-binding transcriptional MerR regulator